MKPNVRLTSFDRLEIYRRSYWSRVLDSLRDDFPGLLAVLGGAAFDRLATAYLADCPSRSFTLRDLGARLEAWLREHPRRAGVKLRMALDMVCLEWAHIQAFDGPAEEVFGLADLLDLSPDLRVGLQPHIALLDLQYPVDEMRVKLKAARVKRKPIYVAVHRWNLSVYYRRLTPEEYRLLKSLRSGKPIASAIVAAFRGSRSKPEEIPELLKSCFSRWSELGWLTARPNTKERLA